MKRGLLLLLFVLTPLFEQDGTEMEVGGIDASEWDSMLKASVVMLILGIVMVAMAAVLDMREFSWERENRRLWIGIKFAIGALGFFFIGSGIISIAVALIAPTIL